MAAAVQKRIRLSVADLQTVGLTCPSETCAGTRTWTLECEPERCELPVHCNYCSAPLYARAHRTAMR